MVSWKSQSTSTKNKSYKNKKSTKILVQITNFYISIYQNMPKPQLSYTEKLQFLSDLRNFYMNDFWMIYDDIPAELWRLKWLSIWLVIDSLKIFFKWNKQPTKDEIILVLSHVLNKEFLGEIYSGKDEASLHYMKSWFWCAVGILLWDKKVINIEKKELEKVCGIEIKCSLI